MTEGGTCRGCAADARVIDDLDDLDQRPPTRDELRARLVANRGLHATSPLPPAQPTTTEGRL